MHKPNQRVKVNLKSRKEIAVQVVKKNKQTKCSTGSNGTRTNVFQLVTFHDCPVCDYLKRNLQGSMSNFAVNNLFNMRTNFYNLYILICHKQSLQEDSDEPQALVQYAECHHQSIWAFLFLFYLMQSRHAMCHSSHSKRRKCESSFCPSYKQESTKKWSDALSLSATA